MIRKYGFLFLFGGLLYVLCELLWRGHSHPAMLLDGGACAILIERLNHWLPWSMALLLQALLATGMILAVELVSGVVLNIYMHLNIWDYSRLPFNLFGQICLYFAGAWYMLSIGAIVLIDYLDYWLFDGRKPQYKII